MWLLAIGTLATPKQCQNIWEALYFPRFLAGISLFFQATYFSIFLSSSFCSSGLRARFLRCRVRWTVTEAVAAGEREGQATVSLWGWMALVCSITFFVQKMAFLVEALNILLSGIWYLWIVWGLWVNFQWCGSIDVTQGMILTLFIKVTGLEKNITLYIFS